MKGAQLRLLVALGNLILLGAIAFLGFQIFRGSPFGPAETPSDSFNPLQYQIADNSGPRSSIQQYSVIWQALDRPKPPPAPPPARPQPQPQQPTVQSLGTRLRVVAVMAADEPDKSTAIVETRGSGQQQMIKVGQKLQGYEVVAIRPDGEDSAVVTVRGPAAKNEDIRLTK